MTPVRYHEAAEEELLAEIGYLELRVAGLGRRFFGEIRKVEEQIARFPQSSPEVAPGVRKCHLQRFPFSLLYSIEDVDLLILAVAHDRRKPRYWSRRVAGRK